VDAGESVLLFATSSNMFNTYLWSPLDIVSNPTTQNTSAIINNTQVFEVIATDSFGCKESDTVIVYRRSLTCGQTAIFVPNAFSPNNDGMNDRFYVHAKNLNKFYVAIYDRWGERVYESTDLTEGWDGTYKGKLLDPSVFGYYVEGVCERDEKFTEQGNITLIR
jgi:gliding motility-associated-like protein